MRKVLLLALILMIGVVGSAPAAEQVAWLVRDGQVQGHLFVPRTLGRPLLLAIEELRHYIARITDEQLPLAWRDPVLGPKNDVGIRLVVRDPESWHGRESGQAFTITEDAHLRMVTIAGNTETAVLYGVYQYLHELGVRWFSPGEIGENVPRLSAIEIGNRETGYQPSFIKRGLSFSGVHANHFDTSDPSRYRDQIHHEYDLWTLRNRLMFQRYIHRSHWLDFGTVSQSGGHGILQVLKGVDLAKEPERFAMVTRDGVRERRDKGAQICFTHPANVSEAIRLAVAFFHDLEATKGQRNTDFDDLTDTFPLGLSDASGICECDTCAKVAGDDPNARDRLVWSFYNQVARGLAKELPGRKVGLYAPYFELTRPPDDVKLEPNIVAVSCRALSWSGKPQDATSYPFTKSHLENLQATRRAGAELRNYDYVMWLGTPQPLSILDAAKAYRELGLRHYHAEVMTRNEQIWPVLWALASYTWNSEQDPRELLASYCEQYYGDEGELILRLLRQIDDAGRGIPTIGYGGYHDTATIMNDELSAQGRADLAAAVERSGGKQQARLIAFRDTFEMFAATAEVYRTYSAALNERTPAAIAAASAQFAAYEQLWIDRRFSATCSPRTLVGIQKMAKVVITPETVPQGRPELADEEVWMRELFAFDEVPPVLPNLFALPEIWSFKLDLSDQGLAAGWQLPELADTTGWHPISTWNFFERQGYVDIGGYFWYRLTTTVPDFPKNKRIFMRIGSLDDGGDIYINGQLAFSRSHDNPDDWQSSFAFEVTDLIKRGLPNLIAVRGHDAAGAGGIWRPCALYTD